MLKRSKHEENGLSIHRKSMNRVSTLSSEFIRKCKEIGVLAAISLGLKKLINEIGKSAALRKKQTNQFDLKYGTDTDGIIKPEALDIPDERMKHAVRYQTALVEVFMDILNGLTISYEQYLFIDLGSGKGRALLLASKFPFKEIIGVELSESLHNIANQNINIYKDKLQQCDNIRSICSDVTNYKIPSNENIIFYLFNPFDEYIMRLVLVNIEESLNGLCNDVFIAYLKPLYRNLFDQSMYFQIYCDTERYVVYRSKNRTLFQ